MAVIQRIDGMGTRRFINLDDMLRAIQSTFNIHNVELWYIDGKTDPLEQALMFCSAHVVISPHSSQLTNLMFSQKDTFVLEVRASGFYEPSFEQICLHKHLRYKLLNEGNFAAYDNGTVINHHFNSTYSAPNYVWASWNTIVDIEKFKEALKEVMKNIISNHNTTNYQG